MSRVTPTELKVIVTTSKSDADLQAIIDIAGRQVDRLALSTCGSSLSTADLKDVELYLSAHILSISSPELNKTSEKFENWSVAYQRGTTDSGLMSSQYGNQANMISGGCLLEMDLRQASVCFFGGA